MYKVFINERPIILTDSLFAESDFDLLNYKNTIISEIIHKLTEGSISGIILLCADLQEAWGDFKSHFKVISASSSSRVWKCWSRHHYFLTHIIFRFQ